MKTYTLTILVLFSIGVCTAQKKHQYSYYDKAPVVEPDATFTYNVEQTTNGYTVQISERKYSVTTAVKSTTSQKPTQMLIKGKFNSKTVKGFNDYAYGGLVADYMTVVPGVGIVGWNEAWKEYADWQYGHPGAGRIKWLIRTDGVAQMALRNEVVSRAGTSMGGLMAKKILYTYSYPQNSKLDMLASDYLNYPPKAFLIQDGKIEKTWDRLACLYTDDRRSLFVDFYGNEYIQLAQYQSDSLATVTTLDHELNIVSEHRNVMRMLKSPQKTWQDHFYRFQVDLLVTNEEIPGIYSVLNKKGQLTVPEGTWGVIPLTTSYKTRNWYDEVGKELDYILLHKYLLPYPQNNGDLHWGMMEDGIQTNITGPIWADWHVYESEEIKANRYFTRANPRIFLAQELDQKWKPHNFFMYTERQHLMDTVTAIMERTVPAIAYEDAITSVEKSLVKLEEKMDFVYHQAKKRNAEREQEQKLRNQRLQEKMAVYRQEQLAAQEARAERYRKRHGTPTSSGSYSITHSQQAKDSYNRTVRQSQERQSMRDYKQELDIKIRSVTR